MFVTLKNDLLTVRIDSHGAQLHSIVNNRTGHEYLWQGNPAYWARRSPVLFPIVGAVRDGKYKMDGQMFSLGQHGFARDCDFDVCDDSAEDEAWFSLKSNEYTLTKYPRCFELRIGYSLIGERLMVKWQVFNLDEKDMAFQIGAHPGFNYPDFNSADEVHGYFHFDCHSFISQRIVADGCVGGEDIKVELNEDCMMPLTATTFDSDAYIVADEQIRRVSLMDKQQRPYITLLFNAPLVGLWSPNKKDAPFVCIEPWWGRCDRIDFSGDFSSREYVNKIAPKERFDAGYVIIIDNL